MKFTLEINLSAAGFTDKEDLTDTIVDLADK